MLAPTLSHSHIGARPSGLFAGMGVMGAMIGSGRTGGWQAGTGAAGLSLGGAAQSRVRSENPGVAACGAESKAKGGKDGAEPFFMEGCGCGGGCGGGGGEVALASRWQNERRAEFRAALAKFSVDAESCSNGWDALLAELVAYGHCKATCDDFGGELALFEFDKRTCSITECDCEMPGWRDPGPILHPRPGDFDFGPELEEVWDSESGW